MVIIENKEYGQQDLAVEENQHHLEVFLNLKSLCHSISLHKSSAMRWLIDAFRWLPL